MKLVDMKQSPAKEMAEISSPMKSDGPQYPYGLRLCLDEQTITKLGFKELPSVKAKFTIECEVEVVALSCNESAMYGENRSMDLQIVAMAVDEGDDQE